LHFIWWQECCTSAYACAVRQLQAVRHSPGAQPRAGACSCFLGCARLVAGVLLHVWHPYLLPAVLSQPCGVLLSQPFGVLLSQPCGVFLCRARWHQQCLSQGLPFCRAASSS
jgi:hypothetical protein